MMFSRRIYLIILTHILLILSTSGVGLWMILSHKGYIVGSLFMICALFQIAGLTKRLNSVNRKIKLFFDAVQDKDNMLYFPEHSASKEQKELNRSLNRINALLSTVQKENKKQNHFYRSLFEEVPNGVLAWNASGQIIMANSAALTLLGGQQLYSQSQVEQLLKEK